jgi:hypothetical protein
MSTFHQIGPAGAADPIKPRGRMNPNAFVAQSSAKMGAYEAAATGHENLENVQIMPG